MKPRSPLTEGCVRNDIENLCLLERLIELQRATEIVTEIRVLQLARSLQELQSLTDVSAIPGIVSRCAADLAHFIEGKSQETKIMKFD